MVTKRCEQNKPLRFHGIARRAPDQSRAPALRPSLHWHRPSLPPLLLLILMSSACTAAVHASVLTCHELHNRACGRRTKVLAAGLLTAFNEFAEGIAAGGYGCKRLCVGLGYSPCARCKAVLPDRCASARVRPARVTAYNTLSSKASRTDTARVTTARHSRPGTRPDHPGPCSTPMRPILPSPW